MSDRIAPHAHMELVDDPKAKSGKRLRLTRPQDVLEVGSKEELDAQLKHYNQSFVSHVVPNSKFARRNYVERLRPALRYYCAKYATKVPEWLANDKQFLDMKDSTKQRLFGTKDLKVREFKALRKRPKKGEPSG